MVKNDDEQSYGHILKYTGIFGGVQGLNIIIGLVRNKIVASLLGPAGMGLTSLFNSVVNFISQSTNLGISFSAVRHVSELFDNGDEERIQHFVKVVRTWSLLTALLGMLVCAVAGPLLSSSTFAWGDHTLHFVMLAPAVGLLAITGGETAILKGARQLKSLAVIQLISIFVALVISVPIYYFFGQAGIVPVIVLMALSTMLLTVRHSFRLYPLKLTGEKGILGEGMEMVRLGIAFVLTGVMATGADMLVRSYLNVVGELDVVGLYNVGYTMTMVYGGMVFVAMETDYFPRLSGVCKDVAASNRMVNNQIEVSLLIIGPMLVAMLFAVPVMIPLLFTSEFMPVVDMMRYTTLALYLRAMKLPVSYIALARGDGKAYLLLEGLYYVGMVAVVVEGYRLGGITGTGIGLLALSAAEFVLLYVFTYFRYHYRPRTSVFVYGGIHILLGIVSLLLTNIIDGWTYWASGVVMGLLALSFSLYVLHSKTALWAKLKEKTIAKIGRRKN
ncbi:MAG: oligosaccharide flippase family protein [Prevotella sp.]|nr:oligosaccharide flippase family protein [Prevotella sp.]